MKNILEVNYYFVCRRVKLAFHVSCEILYIKKLSASRKKKLLSLVSQSKVIPKVKAASWCQIGGIRFSVRNRF